MSRALWGQNNVSVANIILQPLVRMVCQGLFPALRVVSVVLPTYRIGFQQPAVLTDSEKYLLSKLGICFYVHEYRRGPKDV